MGALFHGKLNSTHPRCLVSVCRNCLALQGQPEFQLVAAWIWEESWGISAGRTPVDVWKSICQSARLLHALTASDPTRRYLNFCGSRQQAAQTSSSLTRVCFELSLTPREDQNTEHSRWPRSINHVLFGGGVTVPLLSQPSRAVGNLSVT